MIRSGVAVKTAVMWCEDKIFTTLAFCDVQRGGLLNLHEIWGASFRK